MYRLRITFTKRGMARFIGNLDLHRLWERTLRRAGASLVYSQGFHPAPKIQLASALPLGITSEAEILDIWMHEEVDEAEFRVAVSGALPLGIEVLSARGVSLKEKSLQSRLCSAEYIVEFSAGMRADVLESKVEDILGRAALISNRRGKDYDLRPLIEKLEVCSDSVCGVSLRMRLAARPGATGRPEAVLATMEIHGGRVHRTALFFVDNAH